MKERREETAPEGKTLDFVVLAPRSIAAGPPG
jgi:hypothetical protein